MNPNQETSPQLTPSEAMAMNRKDRRHLGKINGVKIYGSNTAHMKSKPHALTTFTGKRI